MDIQTCYLVGKMGHRERLVCGRCPCRQICLLLLQFPIADAYAEWQLLESLGVDTTALLANGLNHPNAEMHKVFADKLYDVIFM